MLEVDRAPAFFLTIHTAAIFLVVTTLFLLFKMVPQVRAQAKSELLRPRGFLLTCLLFMVIAAGLGLLTGPRGLYLADWLFALALGMTLSLLNPVAAVSFLSANFFLRPWELVPDNLLFENLPKGLAALALLSWLWHGLLNRKLQISLSGPLLLLLFFVFWLYFADFAAGNPQDGWPYLNELILPALVLAFLVMNTVRTKPELEMLTGAVTLSASGLITSALVQTHQIQDAQRLEMVGLLGNSNDLAAVTALVLPLLLSFLGKGKRSLARYAALTAITLLMLYALWLSQSRGARLSLFLALVAYALFFTKFSLRKILITAVLGLAILPFLFSTDRRSEDLSASTQARLSYVVAGWRMTATHPFFGVGVGNYPKLYERYTPSLVEYGERTAHSTWILIMAESGLPALLIFALLYTVALARSWRMRREQPAFFLACISYGVSMTFLSHAYLFLPYLLYSMIMAIPPPPSSNSYCS
ncbi:MAG: O-antigen ligase family protein [Deltaproteobacteria bacterium]|nr:O-antigen ligase family protein [Deltaproteobacteria bacterium]